MAILNAVIILFVILETANVLVLYFNPATKLGNGAGVFNSFMKSQEVEKERLFTKYLVNWVANAKAIFIVLLVLILFFADEQLKLYSCIGMCLSIMLYYVSLNPIIKKLDNDGLITPKGYSKVLFYMITGFVAMFVVAISMYFIM